MGSVRRSDKAGTGALELDDSRIAESAPNQASPEFGARDPFALDLLVRLELLNECTQPIDRTVLLNRLIVWRTFTNSCRHATGE